MIIRRYEVIRGLLGRFYTCWDQITWHLVPHELESTLLTEDHANTRAVFGARSLN